MTINVYDTANQLAKELPQTQQFINLKLTYSKLKSDKIAYEMFKQFNQLQEEIQKKQANGEDINKDTEKLKNMVGKMEKMDAIKQLMSSEEAVNQLLMDINKIITTPITDIYNQ